MPGQSLDGDKSVGGRVAVILSSAVIVVARTWLELHQRARPRTWMTSCAGALVAVRHIDISMPDELEPSSVFGCGPRFGPWCSFRDRSAMISRPLD